MISLRSTIITRVRIRTSLIISVMRNGSSKWYLQGDKNNRMTKVRSQHKPCPFLGYVSWHCTCEKDTYPINADGSILFMDDLCLLQPQLDTWKFEDSAQYLSSF